MLLISPKSSSQPRGVGDPELWDFLEFFFDAPLFTLEFRLALGAVFADFLELFFAFVPLFTLEFRLALGVVFADSSSSAGAAASASADAAEAAAPAGGPTAPGQPLLAHTRAKGQGKSIQGFQAPMA